MLIKVADVVQDAWDPSRFWVWRWVFGFHKWVQQEWKIVECQKLCQCELSLEEWGDQSAGWAFEMQSVWYHDIK